MELSIVCLVVIPAGLVLALLAFWVSQFIQLMLRADDDFPGRYDKVVWGIVFVALPMFAPFLFLWWKSSYPRFRNFPEDDRATTQVETSNTSQADLDAVPCRECGEGVSPDAWECPTCGMVNPAEKP